MIIAEEKARRSIYFCGVVTCLGALALGVGLFLLSPSPYLFWLILLPFLIWGSISTFGNITHRYRERVRLMKEPFPPLWEKILDERVAFYTRLEPEEKTRFEKELQIFLAETPVTGVRCEIDDMIRVLVGASAVIPIFGFPSWEYDMLDEVLVYPHAFDGTLREDDGLEMFASGMVGTDGLFNGVMILSKPDLLRGFEVHGDRDNVGIHEFAHLIDKATGDVDGVPVSLPPESVQPWLRLMHKELSREARERSDIDPYGFTNEEEFFAVASEYFFEAPERLAKNHPELYNMLETIFRQDNRPRFRGLLKRIFRPSRRGSPRNAPCPCGSGKKFKKCCGRRG